MRSAIDDHAAHAADALATVRVESHGLFTGGGQLLIQLVKHLEETRVLRNVVDLVLDKLALLRATRLAPDLQCEFHL